MVLTPDVLAERYIDAGCERLIVHAEACLHLHRTLGAINSMGAHAAVAINPATPASAVAHVLDLVDLVLVMTVNPGFGGQEYLPTMERKIAEVRRMLDDAGTGRHRRHRGRRRHQRDDDRRCGRRRSERPGGRQRAVPRRGRSRPRRRHIARHGRGRRSLNPNDGCTCEFGELTRVRAPLLYDRSCADQRRCHRARPRPRRARRRCPPGQGRPVARPGHRDRSDQHGRGHGSPSARKARWRRGRRHADAVPARRADRVTGVGGRRPLPVSTAVVDLAIRRVLAEAPGSFATVAEHPSTVVALRDLHRELRLAGPDAVAALTASSPRGREAARVSQHTSRRLRAEWYDEGDLLEHAELATGQGVPPQLAHTIVYLPQQLRGANCACCARSALVADVQVILGITGDAGSRRRTGRASPTALGCRQVGARAVCRHHAASASVGRRGGLHHRCRRRGPPRRACGARRRPGRYAVRPDGRAVVGRATVRPTRRAPPRRRRDRVERSTRNAA